MNLKVNQVKQAAKIFAEKWKGVGYEKGDSQRFWMSLLQDVYGIEHPSEYIRFEDRVKLDKTSFIDGFISSTHVMIEQKSIDKDLRKAIKQSDGSLLTPFQQAKRYSSEIPYSERPRWIITCNFKEFHIYDMEKPNGEPEILYLENLESEYYRLSFLVESENEYIKKQEEVSIKAGELVGLLYDSLLKEYNNPENPDILRSLNILCVRLVFCLYAEDAGIFGKKNMFYNFLFKYKDANFRMALINLFEVLNQKPEERDPYLDDDLAAFPYVNGGLFESNNIVVPRINNEIIDIILNEASLNFDWSKISPTIFGSVFESTLNPEIRKQGGMHYTSISNIHKIIDPLFMNELKSEFEEIKKLKILKIKKNKLQDFQNKLASLKFLDPAAGSGNFLTETFISLRKLENEILKLLMGTQLVLGDFKNPIKVSINQFYGIEINDFAVTVAKTALWIAESQMIIETEDIVLNTIDFLPLKTYANIYEGNALKIDWQEIIPKNDLDYILGNPPFIGMKEQSDSNKEDLKLVVSNGKLKQMDYVAGWYFKAAKFIQDTNIEVAFVSSNSICQGEQALTVWEPLFTKYNIIINFAYKSFIWNSEAKNKAHVHCVIVGFSTKGNKVKYLYDDKITIKPDNINHYLLPTSNIFIKKTGTPITPRTKMTKGAQLIDGGHFSVGNEIDKVEVLKKYPETERYIRRYFNAQTLINGGEAHYVLYLKDVTPYDLKHNSYIRNKVKDVFEYRANNKSPSTNKLKDIPSQYFQSQVPNNKSIVVPVVSSINRKYIPICFMNKNMVYTNALFYIDNANLVLFGILTSNVHMAWIKTVCGKLKSDFRYSNTLGYNTFPLPNLTEESTKSIENTAQKILDVRLSYPDLSLADLYDEIAMPSDLRTAHQNNDKAVMEAYGFDWRRMTETECIAEIMKIYQNTVK